MTPTHDFPAPNGAGPLGPAPLLPRPNARPGQPFRVLALDGGGMRAIFTAAYLAELERVLDIHLGDAVDLIVGTSTGGIIGLGLASGMSATDMLRLYLDHGPEIFGRPRWPTTRLFRPKYDRRALDAPLARLFGDVRMRDLRRPVCITSHDLVNGRTRIFRDSHDPDPGWGGDQFVWKIAAATSSAPTFFEPMQLSGSDSHIDGGVWANNPSLVAITEAVRFFGRDLRDIRLVSIGNTARMLRFDKHADAARLGLTGWAFKIIELFQSTVSLATHNHAQLLLPDGQYLRIDDEFAQGLPFDNVDRCRPLQQRGEQVARDTAADLVRVLALGRLGIVREAQRAQAVEDAQQLSTA